MESITTNSALLPIWRSCGRNAKLLSDERGYHDAYAITHETKKERLRPARATMSIEHLAAVWEHSRQSGSGLVVLLAVANYSDQRGEWIADQATLQKRARLSRR